MRWWNSNSYACAKPNAYSDGNCDCDTDSNRNRNRDSNSNSNSNCYRHANRDCNCYRHANGDCNRHSYSHTCAIADTSTHLLAVDHAVLGDNPPQRRDRQLHGRNHADRRVHLTSHYVGRWFARWNDWHLFT
jgi:hypothetical protein